MSLLEAAPLVVLLVPAPVVNRWPWALRGLVVVVAQVLKLRQLQGGLARP